MDYSRFVVNVAGGILTGHQRRPRCSSLWPWSDFVGRNAGVQCYTPCRQQGYTYFWLTRINIYEKKRLQPCVNSVFNAFFNILVYNFVKRYDLFHGCVVFLYLLILLFLHQYFATTCFARSVSAKVPFLFYILLQCWFINACWCYKFDICFFLYLIIQLFICRIYRHIFYYITINYKENAKKNWKWCIILPHYYNSFSKAAKNVCDGSTTV